jgi:hypothetical protein
MQVPTLGAIKPARSPVYVSDFQTGGLMSNRDEERKAGETPLIDFDGESKIDGWASYTFKFSTSWTPKSSIKIINVEKPAYVPDKLVAVDDLIKKPMAVDIETEEGIMSEYVTTPSEAHELLLKWANSIKWKEKPDAK